MKSLVLVKQRGAVLAFTLVMLLLLTLVGVSMIQQNKQQLMMAGNTQQQNQALANVDKVLSFAETYIDGKRVYSVPINGKLVPVPTQCHQPITEFDNPNPLPLNIPNVTSKVTETYCFTPGGEVLRCIHGTDSPDSPGCDAWDNNRTINCKGEIYTIETSAIDTSSGTQRKIESKYAVDCSNGYQ